MSAAASDILSFTHFYLVGIKGVAMTALAQCLLDAGKNVTGSDVTEDFVTAPLLHKHHIKIDTGFTNPIPESTDCVIYSAAHQGQYNPQVQTALNQGLPLFSHAEALASLFNQKHGIAVCGVGGKSTTSAMITWILEKTGRSPAFAIGVGNIPGLDKTGALPATSTIFVAEADEYVTDPSAPGKGEPITPRFSFLKPFVTVCTNLKFDHPDVYTDFDHTQRVFADFFSQIKKDGTLVVNADDESLMTLAIQATSQPSLSLLTFGESDQADFQLQDIHSSEGVTRATVTYEGDSVALQLSIPGTYNLRNAVAAMAACAVINVPLTESAQALADFHSTLRRAEYKGEKQGAKIYDDYAHHPDEVKQVIQAFKEWYPDARLVVAFQSHTFSRTKALLDEFVTAFGQADEVVMIDIFASAREKADSTITSTLLCQAISERFPTVTAHNFKTLPALATHLQHTLKPGDICLTVGAGDIYQVFDLL